MAIRTLTVACVALALVAAVAASVETATISASTLTQNANTVGWRVTDAAVDGAATTKVMIALTRTNQDALTRFVDAVSRPDSARYTQYKSGAALARMTAPSTTAITAVWSWLTASGVRFQPNEITSTITMELTVAQASSLFSTTFRKAVNDVTGQTAIVGDAVTVPMDVVEHVEAVFGVHDLPLPPRRKTGNVGSADYANVTPSVIRQVYNVTGVKPSGSLSNIQAFAEFQGQLLSQSDLTTFFSKYVPDAAPGDDKVYKYVGDSQQGEGVEANLDVQYIMGVAPGIKTEAWQYAGMGFCADLKQWTTQILSTSNPPNVFSVSYGWQGQMSQIGCSTTQIASVDADFKTIAGTGTSIIFASGDSGSGYTSFFGLDAKLYSSWPASSLYVTAVGATGFINSSPSSGQSAVTQFGSGGGFSRIITPAPAWQSAAISTFYSEETKAPNKTAYGYGGRGTPDVAALGEGFQVVVGGNVEPVGGTSAAAPTFSAMISLLNEARIQHGKKPLGFLNHWIYANTDMFTDVTVGSDRISRSGLPVPLGFDCEKGWDPVTGWGVARFGKMLQAAMDA